MVSEKNNFALYNIDVKIRISIFLHQKHKILEEHLRNIHTKLGSIVKLVSEKEIEI